MTETRENLYEKLAKIRKQVGAIKKDAQGYGYTYVKEESILANITGLMDKYKVSLIPSINRETLVVTPQTFKETKTSKQGTPYEKVTNEVLLSADMTWTWVNNENPEERIEVSWVLTGQQNDPSQAFGSALTYSSRYFLLKFFNIATSEDDPDKFRSQQKAAEEAGEKLIASEIINEAHKIIEGYMAKNPDNGNVVKELAEKFIKGGNYFNLKDPALAGKFLADVKTALTEEVTISN